MKRKHKLVYLVKHFHQWLKGMCKPSCWPGAKNRYLNSRSPSLFAAKNKMLVKHYTKLLIPLRNCSNTTTFANHCLQGFDSSAVLGLSFCVCIIIAHILPIAVFPFLWNNNHKKGVYLSCCKRFQVFFLLLWWNLTAAAFVLISSKKWWIFRFSWKALKKGSVLPPVSQHKWTSSIGR